MIFCPSPFFHQCAPILHLSQTQGRIIHQMPSVYGASLDPNSSSTVDLTKDSRILSSQHQSPRHNLALCPQSQKDSTCNPRLCCTQKFQPDTSTGVWRCFHHEWSQFRRADSRQTASLMSGRSNQSNLPSNCLCVRCPVSSKTASLSKACSKSDCWNL